MNRPKREDFENGDHITDYLYWSNKYNKELEAYIDGLEKQLKLYGVGCSLPTSKDRISELEKAIVRWDLKNNINDKQAFSCGWNNCYRWIKDFIREQR